MIQFIIDLNYISLENDNNNLSYYRKNIIIPFNAVYKLFLTPYYQNSTYRFRNFYTDIGFNDIINNVIRKKPTSYKKYNMGSHYIPSCKQGHVIDYEITPIKVKNLIPKFLIRLERRGINKDSTLTWQKSSLSKFAQRYGDHYIYHSDPQVPQSNKNVIL